ncbi:ABC transporter ATP-binding protein, partial [Butyricicoccus sp. 1XD8-22]
MSKIQLKNVFKKYANSEGYSVKDFNLDIEEKEFIVLVGPSGCGKSTTLRM